jgi:glutaredoxin
MTTIKVYGADWCGDTQGALNYLDSLGVDYDYIDVERDAPASEWVKAQNEGKERKPTILVGSRVLAVPKQDELEAALAEEGLIDQS